MTGTEVRSAAADRERIRQALAPFIAGAVLATLTAGSLLGTVNLFRIQVLLEGVAKPLVRLHAFFQLDGLMGLFICGVALNGLPRFWGTAAPARSLVVGVPALMIAALVSRIASVAMAPGHVARALSGGLAVVAGLAFAAEVLRARWTSPRPVSGLDALVVAGAFAFPCGNLLWLLGEWPSPDAPLLDLGAAAGEEILLYGFLCAWLLGMGPRVLPFFTDLGHPRARAPWVLAALLATGVALRAAGLALYESLAVAQAGQLAIACALGGFALSMDRTGSKHLPIAGTMGNFRRAVLAALVWCMVGAALLGASAANALAGFAPLSYLGNDAARHAIAVGFALGMLIAVSTRLVPAFTGVSLPAPRAADLGLVALHAGVALRMVQALAPLGFPGVLGVSGLSGLLVVLGLLPWAGNLIGVAAGFRPGAGPGAPVTSPPEPVPATRAPAPPPAGAPRPR